MLSRTDCRLAILWLGRKHIQLACLYYGRMAEFLVVQCVATVAWTPICLCFCLAGFKEALAAVTPSCCRPQQPAGQEHEQERF